MSALPRILFVAAPDAAVEALDAVRQGGPVEGRLAPTSDILRSTLAKGAESWDAVVFVPGGPVDDVEVAAYVPDSIPLVVVADRVPLLMAGSDAKALPLHELAYLAAALAANRAEPPASSPPLAPDEAAPEETLEDVAPPSALDHDRLASLADHLPVGLYRTSLDGYVIYANPALADILGVPSVEALVSASVEQDLGYPREAFLDALRETGSVRNLVLSWTRRTGERIHTRESARAVRDETGKVLYYEGTIEDVTAETEALRDLRDAEASLSVVADHAPHVLYRLRYTADGSSFDFVSPAIEALTGYSRSEIEARGGLSSLLDHREVVEGEGLTDGPVEGADRFRAVYRVQTAHGERWVENTGRPWCSDAGYVLGLVGVLQDVTERKLREDHLADAAQTALIRQRALVDLAQLEGVDSFGAPAAAIAAATLGADAVSLWRSTKTGRLKPLHAPAALDEGAAGRALEVALSTVASQRAIAIDTLEDDQVDDLGLRPFA
ncbi:PAS domain-containing protein, partial [Rubrivirga sp.]|uniref:PAS domain-containing protein n=1 Tax=Rubrivirga sp. TaxID=1885344 RepID=UPI003C775074